VIPAVERAEDTSARSARSAEQRIPVAADPFWRWTAVAVLLGLVVRVAWVAWVGHQAPLGLFDPARYAGYAAQMAHGKGYVEPLTGQPTAYYPPGYPWFLGVIAWLQAHGPFGDFLPLAAGLVQAVLGAATVAFGAVIARRAVSARAGVVAGFGLALYPNLVFHSGALLSETLYNFLFLGFLTALLVLPWPAGLNNRRVAGAAVLFGLAVLVRPISLAVLPVLLVVWWASARSWASALRWTAITLAVVAALILPWTVRNAVRMHAFIPLSTNTGDNFCIGHHDGATGGFDLNKACNSGEGVQFGSRSEVRNDRIKTSRSLRYLSHHLGREPWLVTRRAYYMFERDDDALRAVQSYGLDRWIGRGAERALADLANGVYIVVGLLGALGLLRLTLSRRPAALLIVLSALATVAVPLAFFGDARFKVPVMPLLVIAAAAAVSRFDPATSTEISR